MAKKYEDQHRVTLSVMDWLKVRIALREAKTWNEDKGHKACGDDITDLIRAIEAQTNAAISSASIHVAKAINAQAKARRDREDECAFGPVVQS